MALVISINSIDRTSLLLAQTFSVILRADNRHECSFTLKTTAAGFIPRVGQNLQITLDGSLLFGGIIKTAPQHRPGVGIGTDTIIFVDVTSNGYHSIPQRRTVSAWYRNILAGDIVKDFRDKYLSEEGITAGTISNGATLVAYNARVKSLKEVLDELADISGFKWYIDNSKALQFKQEDAIVAAAHDIVEGGVFTDFRDVSVEENLETYRNKQVIIGAVQEDGSPLLFAKQLDAEITARQAVEGGSGVYGDIFIDGSITTGADAEIIADNMLKKDGTVPLELIFDSGATDWRAGTKLMANLPTFGISSNTYFLVDEVEIYDATGLHLRSRVTAIKRNTTDFSTQRKKNYVDYFSDLVRNSKAVNDVAESNRGIAYYIDGTLALGLKASLKAPIALKIKGVVLEVDTAPTGADLIIDVNKNDTTVYTTQANRPRITAGSKTGTGVTPDITAIAKGDKITVEIDQVGSTVAGGNLSVTVVCGVG